MQRTRRSLPAAQVAALQALRTRFDPGSTEKRAALLDACAACALTNPRVVLRYHETLLFVAAHPDSRRIAAQVEAELQRIAEASPALFRSSTGEEILAGSGLAGETIEASFSIALIEWLLERVPDAIGIAWDQGATNADLDDLVNLSLLPAERDGRLHPRFDMERWLRFATGPESDAQRDLRWLIERLHSVVPDFELRNRVVDWAELYVRWRLTVDGPTRTLTRFPARRLFVQRSALKRTFGVKALLRRPLPEPVRLSPAAAQDLIDVARGVLAVRQREADPVTYANPREVALFTLDRGVDVALFGLEPARRLPLESYFGYVAARNRVPIAYGGAWLTDRRAEIGMHLFDTLRGGESAYLFGQILRTYHQHYGATRFRVDPYQIGADNPEAIRSGAFWFYYRFGFRPHDAALRDVAAREWKLIRGDRTYRTAPGVLRRFTKSALLLDVDGDPGAHHIDPTRLGIAVTETIRQRGANRVATQRWAVRRVSRLLPDASSARWSSEETAAFERLCPLVAAIPGLEHWSLAQRRALAAVLRAKGGPRERDFVRGVQRHRRLRDALAELEASVDWDHVPARPSWREP